METTQNMNKRKMDDSDLEMTSDEGEATESTKHSNVSNIINKSDCKFVKLQTQKESLIDSINAIGNQTPVNIRQKKLSKKFSNGTSDDCATPNKRKRVLPRHVTTNLVDMVHH